MIRFVVVVCCFVLFVLFFFFVFAQLQIIMFNPIIQRNKFQTNTANWTQPMRTHDLTQAEDPESYARSIQSQISFAIC